MATVGEVRVRRIPRVQVRGGVIRWKQDEALQGLQEPALLYLGPGDELSRACWASPQRARRWTKASAHVSEVALGPYPQLLSGNRHSKVSENRAAQSGDVAHENTCVQRSTRCHSACLCASDCCVGQRGHLRPTSTPRYL